MKEIYEKSYIAIPVPEGPLLSLLRDVAFKDFYHMSIYRFLEMDDEKAQVVRSFFEHNSSLLKQIILKPEKISVIGDKTMAHVLKAEETEQLEILQASLRVSFPESADLNLRYTPHVTLKNNVLNPTSSKFKSRDIRIGQFPIKSIGLYYRTEENATALLVCHHI